MGCWDIVETMPGITNGSRSREKAEGSEKARAVGGRVIRKKMRCASERPRNGHTQVASHPWENSGS